MRWLVYGLPSVFVLVCPVAYGANAYKCKAADGSITFQDRPCMATTTELDRVQYDHEPDAPHTQYVPSRDGPNAVRPGNNLLERQQSERPVPSNRAWPNDRGIGAPTPYPTEVTRCRDAYGRIYIVPLGQACLTSVVAGPENSTPPTGPVLDRQGRPLDARWIAPGQAVDNRTGQVLRSDQILPASVTAPAPAVRKIQDEGQVVDRTAACEELRDKYKHLPVNTSRKARDALDKQIADNCVKKSLWQ